MNLKKHQQPVQDGLGNAFRKLFKENYKEIQEALKKAGKVWKNLAKGFEYDLDYSKENDQQTLTCYVTEGGPISVVCCVMRLSLEGEFQIIDRLEDKTPVTAVNKIYKQHPKMRRECMKLLRKVKAYDTNKKKIFDKMYEVVKPYEELIGPDLEELSGLEDSRRNAVMGLVLRLVDSTSDKVKELKTKFGIMDAVQQPCLFQFMEDNNLTPETLLKELDAYMSTDDKREFIDCYVDMFDDLPESLSDSLQEMIDNGEAENAEAILKELNEYWSSEEKADFIIHCEKAFDLA